MYCYSLSERNAARASATRATATTSSPAGACFGLMMAVYDRILRPEVYPNLAPVINQFLDDTLTDLSRAEITSLTCIVARVPPESIRMYAIERDMVNSTRTTEGAAVLVPNPILVANLVYEF